MMETEEKTLFGVGNREIDEKLGGGVPIGSLLLTEGQSDAGKSVLALHLLYGALRAGFHGVYYAMEHTVKSLIKAAESLGMSMEDHFLLDRVRIYPITLRTGSGDVEEYFDILLEHFAALPGRFRFITVDSITHLITHSDDTTVIDFFSKCKDLCDDGYTINLVAHSYSFDEQMFVRVRALCDGHLRLRLEEAGERLVKALEVLKIQNAERRTGNVIMFDIEPNMGMRPIPMSRAQV